MSRTLGTLVAVVALGWSTAGAAQATAPSTGWEDRRSLACAGEGTVVTYLTPAGFGTPYHVVDSTDVIVPMHVVATRGDVTVTSIDVPGFDPERADAVRCTYTDPAGFFVTVDGIRTGG
jgi:hypothetical protein